MENIQEKLHYIHCKKCIGNLGEGETYQQQLEVATNGTHIIVICKIHKELVGRFMLKEPIKTSCDKCESPGEDI